MSKQGQINVGALRAKKHFTHSMVYLFCILVAAISFYPFFVMVVSSTYDNFNIVSKINVVPGTNLIKNYERLTQNIDLFRGIGNSIFLSVTTTVIETYFTVMTAYAFAKFNFKFKNLLFGLVLLFMMVPGQLGIIGFYKEIQALDLMNSYSALIIPSIANCFAVFFYRQYMETSVPNTTFEYTELQADAQIEAGQAANASVTVANIGDMDSDTVVEFYLNDLEASVEVSRYRLCGFRHVTVKAGERMEVSVQIAAEMFTIVTEEGERVYEPGRFILYAGGTQPDDYSERLAGSQTISTLIELV